MSMSGMNMHCCRIQPRQRLFALMLVSATLAGCQSLQRWDWLPWPWQQDARNTTEEDDTVALQRAEVARLVELGNRAFTQDKLSVPQQDCAVFYYRQALALDPANNDAKAGLDKVVKRYRSLARTAHDNGHRSQARRYLQRAIDISGATEENAAVRKTLQQTAPGSNPRSLVREPVAGSTQDAHIKAARQKAGLPDNHIDPAATPAQRTGQPSPTTDSRTP